jgi:hypothetical protein
VKAFKLLVMVFFVAIGAKYGRSFCDCQIICVKRNRYQVLHIEVIQILFLSVGLRNRLSALLSVGFQSLLGNKLSKPRFFVGFPHFLQSNAEIVPQIRS